MGAQNAQYRGGFSWVRRAASMLTVVFAVASPAAVKAQTVYNNYQQLGCYFHPVEKKLWLAAIGLTPKALDKDFYDDPNFSIIMRSGDQRFALDGKDAVVNLLKDFDFKGAEKYKLVKYNLVIDYSSSIPATVRTDILNFLDKFVGRLPLAVEGQLIRFSDKVEKFPFTSNKSDIQLQLRQPISYGMTSLHDAMMEAASSLIKDGANTPVRIIVMFTDGFDTSSEKYKDRQSFISTFTNLVKQERIAVLVVGVSNEQDTELLRAITDLSKGVAGYYLPVADFGKFGQAFDQITNMMRNIVLFRLPKLGPDKGKMEISLGTKSLGGNFSTFQQFACEY